jgi:dTDP-4-amino-4,6-dideoxygalactose transaminase
MHSYRNYVVRVRDREQVRAGLAEAGIATALPYVPPLHLQPAFAHLGHRRGDFPITEAAADEVLALPLGPHLDDEHYAHVVASLARL